MTSGNDGILRPFSVTLTYSAGAGGKITGTGTQVIAFGDDGTEVSAVANSGYHFVSWSDGILTAARTDTNVTGNVSVTANFAADAVTYTIAPTAGTHG